MSLMRHPSDGRLHFSELKLHARSAAHVKFACEELKKREMTRPMTVGSVADCLVFGQRGYALYPGKVRNGKDWEAFKAENAGKIHCIQSELDDAEGAANAVLANYCASQLLKGSQYQVVAHWERDGIGCAAGIAGERGGFDAINVAGRYIADLKITATTQPEELMRHAWRMHWPAQGAWYVDGAMRRGLAIDTFYLLCVESTPPHCVTTLRLTYDRHENDGLGDSLISGALEVGHKQCSLWIERHRACEGAGVWPGYRQQIVDLEVPQWLESE